MKLTKEKKQHLILVILGAAVICGGLWFGLIDSQHRRLKDIRAQMETSQEKARNMRSLIDSADRIGADLEAASARLERIESTFGGGDLYSWFILLMREFQMNYAVSTPEISREVIGDVNLLPKFPYKQATYVVRGTAYYEDLGRFVSAFENEFPYFRILNLDVAPLATDAAERPEKLTFSFEVAALVKPGTAPEK